MFINLIDSQGSDGIINVNNLPLTAEVSQGSTIIKYTLSSDNPTSYDTTVTFNHILKVFTGDTLTISTGITLNSFQSATSFVLTFDDVNFYNLNKQSRFSEVDIFPIPVKSETKISEATVFSEPPSPTYDFVILDIPENDLNSGLIIYVNDIVVLDIPENDLNYGLVIFINDIVVLDIPENDLNYGLVI